MNATQHGPSSSSEPSELDAALQRCSALEGELSQLKREHERTTAKLSHLLKKRGGSDDGGETETGAELAQLRQQVAVLQWREQQYKQALLARSAPSAPSTDQRPQPPPTTHFPSRAGIPDTEFQPRAGIPDTQPRFAAAARQASMPSRQITPPSPAPVVCGVKRNAPSDESHVVRRCAFRVSPAPFRSPLLTPQVSLHPLAGQAQAFDGTHDRDRAPHAAAALGQPTLRRPCIWVHGRGHQHPAARDKGSSGVRGCLVVRVDAAPLGVDAGRELPGNSLCSEECRACAAPATSGWAWARARRLCVSMTTVGGVSKVEVRGCVRLMKETALDMPFLLCAKCCIDRVYQYEAKRTSRRDHVTPPRPPSPSRRLIGLSSWQSPRRGLNSQSSA